MQALGSGEVGGKGATHGGAGGARALVTMSVARGAGGVRGFDGVRALTAVHGARGASGVRGVGAT